MSNCMDCGGSECVCKYKRLLKEKDEQIAELTKANAGVAQLNIEQIDELTRLRAIAHGAQSVPELCSVETALRHERDEHLRLVGDLIKANDACGELLERAVDEIPCDGAVAIQLREEIIALLERRKPEEPPAVKLGPAGEKTWPPPVDKS